MPRAFEACRSWFTITTIGTALFLGYMGYAFGNIYTMVVPGGFRGFTRVNPDGSEKPTLDPLWVEGDLLDVEAYLTAKPQSGRRTGWHSERTSMRIWHETGIPFGFDTASTLELAMNVSSDTVPPKLWEALQRHQAWMHLYVSHAGVSPRPSDKTHDPYRSVHTSTALFKSAVVKRELRRPRWRLLFDKLGDCGCGVEVEGQTAMEAEEAEHERSQGDRENLPIPHWIPIVSSRFVVDANVYPHDQVPGNVGRHLTVKSVAGEEKRTHEYRAVVFHDDMQVTNDVLVAWNSSIERFPLELRLAPSGVGRWQFFLHMQNSIQLLKNTMGGDESDADEMRRLMTQTSPMMLAIAMIISTLHLLFDALAFKSDISFWSGLESLRGLSTSAVVSTLFCEIIITAFLHHEGSSMLVILPACFGIAVQAWKVVKVWRVKRTIIASEAKVKTEAEAAGKKAATVAAKATTTAMAASGGGKAAETKKKMGAANAAAETREESGKAAAAVAAPATKSETASKVSTTTTDGEEVEAIVLAAAETAAKAAAAAAAKADRDLTQHYDRLASKYLGTFLYPVAIAYAAYSLLCTGHEGLYEWALSALVAGVYTFGFITMTPQLFINYKLKSVEHLPWKFLIYRFLNTFIDDVFAFIITMPTMHRLSCFRDDIVFFIYIYQRWIYAEDKSRPALAM